MSVYEYTYIKQCTLQAREDRAIDLALEASLVLSVEDKACTGTAE